MHKFSRLPSDYSVCHTGYNTTHHQPTLLVSKESVVNKLTKLNKRTAQITSQCGYKPVLDVNKHLHLISVAPILSKIVKEYVVHIYIKPAVLEKIDPQQFGTVPKSSTMDALISDQIWVEIH